MKISVLQENLARGLSIVGRAISPRSTLPVLGNVLIATDEGRIRLSATNLEIGVTCWIDGQVWDDGQITVPAKLFAEFVAQLPVGERVDMDLNTRTLILNVKCARFAMNIKCISGDEFPVVPTSSDGTGAMTSVTISTNALNKAIKQVSFAASVDESRPVLTTIYTNFAGSTMTLAATDGFRLAVSKTALVDAVKEETVSLIPARSLAELGRIIAALPKVKDSTVTIYIGTGVAKKVSFELPDVFFTSQLIDANFPEYMYIVPKSYATRAIIDRHALIQALKVSELFSKDSFSLTRFEIDAGEGSGTVTITSASSLSGDNLTDLDATITGAGLTIAFNGKYTLDVLNAIDTAQVALEVSRANLPGTIYPVIGGLSDENFLSVIMPMAITAP